jgi:hypothetical protein
MRELPEARMPIGLRKARLRIELLEDRAMLAFATFAVNLYRDVDGRPGPAITEGTVQVGESFFAELTAREDIPYFHGFADVALDIFWDPAILTEIDTSFDPGKLITEDLPAFQTGWLSNITGRIQDLGGSTSLDEGRAIGESTAERFALLHFRAVSASNSASISLTQGVSRIVAQPGVTFRNSQLEFVPATIVVASASDAEPQAQPASPSPAVGPASVPLAAAEISAPFESPCVQPPAVLTVVPEPDVPPVEIPFETVASEAALDVQLAQVDTQPTTETKPTTITVATSSIDANPHSTDPPPPVAAHVSAPLNAAIAPTVSHVTPPTQVIVLNTQIVTPPEVAAAAPHARRARARTSTAAITNVSQAVRTNPVHTGEASGQAVSVAIAIDGAASPSTLAQPAAFVLEVSPQSSSHLSSAVAVAIVELSNESLHESMAAAELDDTATTLTNEHIESES